MTLKRQLFDANKKTFSSQSEPDTIRMHYQYAIIEEIASILKGAGYNIRNMNISDLKGRHVNRILSYWFLKSPTIVILKQKFGVLNWWANYINNIGVLQKLDFYIEKLKLCDLNMDIIDSNETLNHIMLPSDICLECNNRLEWKIVFKPVFHCKMCDKYVGFHRDTLKPLGYIADPELRKWRIKAHDSIDFLWKKKMVLKSNLTASRARKLAYKWLADQLGIHHQLAHIGFFDQYLCEKVVELCSPYIRNSTI